MMAFALEAPAEDWPQFLGPRANGISTETNLIEKWPTNGPPVVWQKEIGTGYSAPSVRDGLLVYTPSIQGTTVGKNRSV
jgi:hypothetical protein